MISILQKQKIDNATDKIIHICLQFSFKYLFLPMQKAMRLSEKNGPMSTLLETYKPQDQGPCIYEKVMRRFNDVP